MKTGHFYFAENQTFLLCLDRSGLFSCHYDRNMIKLLSWRIPSDIEYPGAVYHITSRGNEKKPIFKDERDREILLDTLSQADKRYNWLCHAYCLMNNHYHLIVETPDG